MKLDDYLNQIQEAEGFHGLPKGWTHKSVEKFGKSLTGKEGIQKDFHKKCVEKMKGKIDNPDAYCASLKDEETGSTYWRNKSPEKARKHIKKYQNVKQD